MTPEGFAEVGFCRSTHNTHTHTHTHTHFSYGGGWGLLNLLLLPINIQC